jgi:hypothetical protein
VPPDADYFVSDKVMGKCRCGPPQVIVKAEQFAVPYAVWPEVEPTDWCGKFAFREA